MSEKAHDFGVDLTDAIELLERPRLTVSSASAVDPEAIAAEVFHRRIDPGAGPAKVKALLDELLQVKADGSIALAPPTDLTIQRTDGTAVPLDRRYVPAAAAVEALSRFVVDSLDRIRPLSGLAGAKKCDPAPALGFVRMTTAGIGQQFASGEPIDPAVDAALADLQTVLGGLKTNLGIGNAANICGEEDEQVVADFAALESFVETARERWKERTGIRETFTGAKFDRIRRQLAVVVLTLHRLQREVPALAWSSTTIGNLTPDQLWKCITAGQLWKWMRTDAGTTAPALLQARTEDAVPRIYKTYAMFKALLEELADGNKTVGCGAAFGEGNAKKILDELICLVGRIVAETKP